MTTQRFLVSEDDTLKVAPREIAMTDAPLTSKQIRHVLRDANFKFGGADLVLLTEVRKRFEEAIAAQPSLVARPGKEQPLMDLIDLYAISMTRNDERRAKEVREQIVVALSAPPSPPVAAPAFTSTGLLKLENLLQRGYVVAGLAIEKTMEGAEPSRGFITAGGFVGWWRSDHAPQPPRPVTAPLSDARLLIGTIVNKHGDPEAFVERELQIDGDIQKLPIGTRVYVDRAARVLTRAGHQTMHEAMLDGAEIVSRGHPTTPMPKD